MRWRTVTVSKENLEMELVAIRWAGGTVVSSQPCPKGYLVTYLTKRS
jgi:hypothetical protein